ncbi:hypothetical protein NSA47_02255 [Irregularibacter muris]|uniref:RNA polymerase sigma-70 region 4 domain-containing protein n=1 Tax=Irregularibacter muris TaxID=1796619 RepID=A0AAE3KYN3_9FIRM|nr:hypothetical protein [Irregularibacter muris]MCR1897810.1 hypothetical protein [Irregularibacter muris]
MSYTLKDYKEEIKIRKNLIRLAQKRRDKLVKLLGPKGYSSGRSYVDADNIHGDKTMDLNEVIEKISRIDNEIYLHECDIEYNTNKIKEIEECIGGLKGLKCKVKNMQMIEGKTLKEIADELGYSYDYIREIAVKNK